MKTHSADVLSADIINSCHEPTALNSASVDWADIFSLSPVIQPSSILSHWMRILCCSYNIYQMLIHFSELDELQVKKRKKLIRIANKFVKFGSVSRTRDTSHIRHINVRRGRGRAADVINDIYDQIPNDFCMKKRMLIICIIIWKLN